MGKARALAEVSQARELRGSPAILMRTAQHPTRTGCQSWRIDATLYLKAGWVVVEPVPHQLAQPWRLLVSRALPAGRAPQHLTRMQPDLPYEWFHQAQMLPPSPRDVLHDAFVSSASVVQPGQPSKMLAAPQQSRKAHCAQRSRPAPSDVDAVQAPLQKQRHRPLQRPYVEGPLPRPRREQQQQ